MSVRPPKDEFLKDLSLKNLPPIRKKKNYHTYYIATQQLLKKHILCPRIPLKWTQVGYIRDDPCPQCTYNLGRETRNVYETICKPYRSFIGKYFNLEVLANQF